MPAQQIMRSEGLRAQAQSSLADDQGVEQASARSGARVVPGVADPPLDAGIKLSYPSYPFFGSTVTVGDEGAAASTPAYSSQPVSSGYSSYPMHAPAPAPVAVQSAVWGNRFGGNKVGNLLASQLRTR